MAKLIKISDYIKQEYDGKAPDRRTIIAQIERGELPGEKRGGLWFVKVESFNPLNNPLLEKVLHHGC